MDELHKENLALREQLATVLAENQKLSDRSSKLEETLLQANNLITYTFAQKDEKIRQLEAEAVILREQLTSARELKRHSITHVSQLKNALDQVNKQVAQLLSEKEHLERSKEQAIATVRREIKLLQAQEPVKGMDIQQLTQILGLQLPKNDRKGKGRALTLHHEFDNVVQITAPWFSGIPAEDISAEPPIDTMEDDSSDTGRQILWGLLRSNSSNDPEAHMYSECYISKIEAEPLVMISKNDDPPNWLNAEVVLFDKYAVYPADDFWVIAMKPLHRYNPELNSGKGGWEEDPLNNVQTRQRRYLLSYSSEFLIGAIYMCKYIATSEPSDWDNLPKHAQDNLISQTILSPHMVSSPFWKTIARLYALNILKVAFYVFEWEAIPPFLTDWTMTRQVFRDPHQVKFAKKSIGDIPVRKHKVIQTARKHARHYN